MSEQRFIAIHGVKYHRIEDDEKGYVYYSEDAQSIDLLVGLLNEQQATIRKLQDLCGESDGENAKLRIENKRLQKELNDCEKFRYTVFKRLNDEHIKECSMK